MADRRLGLLARPPSRAGAALIWLVLLLVALANLPFGWWREGLRKLSPAWFVAVHAPVPIVVALRFAFDLPFRWATLPLFVGAYFAGQLSGGWLRRAAVAAREPAA